MSSELILIIIVCTVIFASVVIFAVTNSKIKEEMKLQKLKDEAKKQQEELKMQESINKSKVEKTKKVLDETNSRVNAYIESVIVNESEQIKNSQLGKASVAVEEVNKRFNLIENSILFEDSSLSSQQEIAKEHLNDNNLFGEDFKNQANNVSDILNDLDINDYQSVYNTKSISHNLYGDKMIDRLENPVANEYKNLSKQLKVLIISNALNKKE